MNQTSEDQIAKLEKELNSRLVFVDATFQNATDLKKAIDHIFGGACTIEPGWENSNYQGFNIRCYEIDDSQANNINWFIVGWISHRDQPK